MSDLSSADEDALRRMQNKSRVHKNPVTASAAECEKLEDLSVVAKWLQLPISELPQMSTLGELVQQQPHLADETDCKLASGKRVNKDNSSNNSESGDAQAIQQQQQQQSQTDPYQIQAFLKLRSSLPIPRFYCPDDRQSNLSQSELEQQLMEGKLQLVCLSAEFESSLLAEGGERMDVNGVVRKFPTCRYGESCVGSTHRIRGLESPVQFTALMFPDEYKLFLQNGTVPRVQRPCILCCRWILVVWNILCRDLLMQGKQGVLKPSEDKPWHMESTQCVQLYYNTMDREGGYYSHYCVTPNVREPLLQPMVRFNRSKLRAFLHNNRWYIDQRALVWKPPQPPQPQIGESVRNF